jgi:hypothetical protein
MGGITLMPEYQPRATPTDASRLLAGYLDTLEWCELLNEPGEGQETSDREAFELSVRPHWDADSVKQAKEDLSAFLESASLDELLSDTDDWYGVGHDFALTRNGHGAGFWDGNYAHGDELTELCRPFGSVYVQYDQDSETLSIH